MNVRMRLAAALVAFLLPALALARWTASPAAAAAEVGLPILPESIGPWALAFESQISDVEMAMIRPDAHLVRGYEATDRAPVLLYVGLYGGRAGYDAGAHDPEVCYPAQGWQIVGSRDVEIPVAGGETLHAKLLDSHKGTERQVVLYWFQPAGRWPASAAVEQLLRIVDAIAGRPQYAFVRLSAPGGPNAAPTGDLADFAARVSGAIRGALDGAPPGSAQPREAARQNAPPS